MTSSFALLVRLHTDHEPRCSACGTLLTGPGGYITRPWRVRCLRARCRTWNMREIDSLAIADVD